MEFSPVLQEGILIKRYKRFLADIKTAGDSKLTLHCPNTGSMRNCSDPACRVWYSTSDNHARKYPHTWELVENVDGDLVGINTGQANRLVEEALRSGLVRELSGYDRIRAEVSFGSEKSRIDFLLGDESRGELPDCYVEVKNVSLCEGDGLGVFPDAATVRGQKHLRELMNVRRKGDRAVLLFCVQHSGIDRVAPADHIDPEYGRLLREANVAGVELLAYKATLSPREIRLTTAIPVVLD